VSTSPDSGAPDRAPRDDARDRVLRGHLSRALRGLRSLVAGREGADQEGLLAERTLLISRPAQQRRDRPRDDPPPSDDGDRD
jgi:hypothetical protein